MKEHLSMLAPEWLTVTVQVHRQSHVHVGGKHCKDLGSDVCGWSDLSEADLDVIIESM